MSGAERRNDRDRQTMPLRFNRKKTMVDGAKELSELHAQNCEPAEREKRLEGEAPCQDPLTTSPDFESPSQAGDTSVTSLHQSSEYLEWN